MGRYKRALILSIIVITASLLRSYNLGTVPPSLTWDEAAWGYNAYTLGIDGRDEFGRLFPLNYLESFGDFKPPAYAYLTVLPVKLFGLSDFAVRFPSAFFGTLTVIVTYFLVKELFRKTKEQSNKKTNYKSLITSYVPLVSAGLLSISPWHINLSRAAFEANVASFFIITGVWLFLRSQRANAWLLVLSGTSFALSLYTFNTARIVAPFLVLILAIGFLHKLMKKKKQACTAFLVSLFLCIPFIQFMLTPQAKLRYHEVNIFSNLSIIERSNQSMENDKKAIGGDTIPLWSRILHNRRIAYAREYFKHYFDHFNPSFLFIKGDGNPKFSTQDVGQLYLWSFPFLIVGLLYIIRERRGYWWIVPVWLLIGIVPAAFARETPHALRIETTLPTWQTITAYGIVTLYFLLEKHISRSWVRKSIIGTLSLILIGSVVYYLHGYYAHYSREYSGEWQYGYKQALEYAESVKGNYDKIVFTKALGRPYIYVLYHTKADPNLLREHAVIEREVLGFVHVNELGNYAFMTNPLDYNAGAEKVLYIDVPKNAGKDTRIVQTFYLLNNEPVLVAYEK